MGHIHILCLSYHSPSTTTTFLRIITIIAIMVIVGKWPHQEKKRHGYGHLFSALFRLRLLHNHARISCGPYLSIPIRLFIRPIKGSVRFFLELLFNLAGPGMFGYRHCIPGMNGRHLGPILGFFSASNQTNNDASGRCRHTKAFWFIFYLDILLFLTFFGSCFLLFFPISVSTADIWCFGVLAQK